MAQHNRPSFLARARVAKDILFGSGSFSELAAKEAGNEPRYFRPRKTKSALADDRFFDFFDSWYFKVLDSSYYRLAAYAVVTYSSICLFFSFLTWPFAENIKLSAAEADGSAASAGSSFAVALSWSVTHVITMGYGQFSPYDFDRSEPDLGLLFLATFQQFVGILVNVLAFSVMVTKIQHPSAAIVFARQALVTTRNGQRVLLFRIGNLRCNHIFMPAFRLSLLRSERTKEGEHYMKWLPLIVTEIPVVTAVCVAEHIIDGDSPLQELSEEWMETLQSNTDFALSLTFTGRDGVYHDDICAAHRYFRDDLVFGRLRFADTMEVDPRSVKHAEKTGGKPRVFANFDKIGDFVDIGGGDADEEEGDEDAESSSKGSKNLLKDKVEKEFLHLAKFEEGGAVGGTTGAGRSNQIQIASPGAVDVRIRAEGEAEGREALAVGEAGAGAMASNFFSTVCNFKYQYGGSSSSSASGSRDFGPEAGEADGASNIKVANNMQLRSRSTGECFGQLEQDFYSLHTTDVGCVPSCFEHPLRNVVYLFCSGDTRGSHKDLEALYGAGEDGDEDEDEVQVVEGVSSVVDTLLKAARIPHQCVCTDMLEKPSWVVKMGKKATTPAIFYNGTYMEESADILELIAREFGESHIRKYLAVPDEAEAEKRYTERKKAWLEENPPVPVSTVAGGAATQTTAEGGEIKASDLLPVPKKTEKQEVPPLAEQAEAAPAEAEAIKPAEAATALHKPTEPVPILVDISTPEAAKRSELLSPSKASEVASPSPSKDPVAAKSPLNAAATSSKVEDSPASCGLQDRPSWKMSATSSASSRKREGDKKSVAPSSPPSKESGTAGGDTGTTGSSSETARKKSDLREGQHSSAPAASTTPAPPPTPVYQDTFQDVYKHLHLHAPRGEVLPKFVMACMMTNVMLAIRTNMVMAQTVQLLEDLSEVDADLDVKLEEMKSRRGGGAALASGGGGTVVVGDVAEALAKLRERREEVLTKLTSMDKARKVEIPKLAKNLVDLWACVDEIYKNKASGSGRWLHGDGQRLSLDDCVMLPILNVTAGCMLFMYPMARLGWPPQLPGLDLAREEAAEGEPEKEEGERPLLPPPYYFVHSKLAPEGATSTSGDENNTTCGHRLWNGRELILPTESASDGTQQPVHLGGASFACSTSFWTPGTALKLPHIEKALRDFQQTDLYRAVCPGGLPFVWTRKLLEKKSLKMFGFSLPPNETADHLAAVHGDFYLFLQNEIVLPEFVQANRQVAAALDAFEAGHAADVAQEAELQSEAEAAGEGGGAAAFVDRVSASARRQDAAVVSRAKAAGGSISKPAGKRAVKRPPLFLEDPNNPPKANKESNTKSGGRFFEDLLKLDPHSYRLIHAEIMRLSMEHNDLFEEFLRDNFARLTKLRKRAACDKMRAWMRGKLGMTSPRRGGAGAGRGEREEAGGSATMEESKIVERVLECSFEPSSPHFVKAVVDQLTEAEAPSFNRADLIVEAKCGLLAPTSPNPQMRQLVYLHSCFLRADDFAKKSKGVTDEVKKKLPDLMRLLARYANLVLTMPELFSDPDGNGNMSVVAGSALLREIFCPGSTAATAPAGGGLGLTTGTAGGSSSSSTMGSGAPQGQRVFSLNFTHLLATTIVEELDPQDDAEQTVRNLFEPALDELMQRLKGRQFADHKMYDLGFFTSLMKTKGYLPRVVAKYSKQFLPEAQKSLYSTKIAPQGFVLQMESMIGSLLCPTTMDTLLYKESSVMEQALDVINPLLRAGDESREGVLKWLSEALKGNEPRAKGANQIHEGGDHQHFLDTLENSPLPIHQNLDMRLMMQLQNCRTHGYSTPGFGLNLFWLLLELNRPVKLSASGNVLDPAIFGSDAEAGKLLAALADDAKMGDEETVKLAKSSLRMANLDENGNEKKFKFATQVFSLLLKAFHVCLVPVVKEDMCFVSGFSHLWTKAPEKADPCFMKRDQIIIDCYLPTGPAICFGEHLCIETIVQQEQFLSALVHGVNLLCLYLLTAAYPSCRSKVSERPDRPIDAFSGVAIPPKDVSPEWSVLPTVLIENLVAILEYFRDVQHPPTAQHAFYQRIDADILLLTLVFILGAGDHVKNPSTRGKVVNVISYLIKNAKFSNRLQEFLPVANNMIPSCINVFNAVEKTKQSYYDIRMQLKFQLRVPIMELFGMLIPKEEHKANLRRYALNYEEDFLKFLNLLMSDATLQLDEGMDTLAAIRKRAAKRAAGTAAAAPAGGDDLEELLATGTAGTFLV
eukprot:g4993.t1